MNKDVLVSINGLQMLEDSGDTVEILTAGEYYNKNGKHFVVYEELDEDSGVKTQNIIKITHDSIEIKKKGMVNTKMLFEDQKANQSYYSTPFGDFYVEINTNHIDIEEKNDIIDVKIDYSLLINNKHMSDCQISVNIKEIQS